MEVLEEFRYEARDAWEWLESIVTDITPEQALWQPPGRANTIVATYAHIVRNADEDLNEHLFERPRLNEARGAAVPGSCPARATRSSGSPTSGSTGRRCGATAARCTSS